MIVSFSYLKTVIVLLNNKPSIYLYGSIDDEMNEGNSSIKIKGIEGGISHEKFKNSIATAYA